MPNQLLDRLKPILHQTPLVGPVLREAARQYRSWTHRRMTTADTFTEIYRSNAWDGTDSVSGRGSDASQTARLVTELPGVLRDLRVTSLLDIPCGDFFWMKQVDLAGIQYTGADIVPELV